jgi:hypothetical protein
MAITEQELIEKMRDLDAGKRILLHEELTAELGEDEANTLWDGAISELDHDDAVADAVKNLDQALKDALAAVVRAGNELGRLDNGDAWHVEYEYSTGDMHKFLDDAERMIHAVQMHHEYIKRV